MFGILAESLKTAVFGATDDHRGHWPRNERTFLPRSEFEDELRRNPYVQFRDFRG
jgi:hypothetical protein